LIQIGIRLTSFSKKEFDDWTSLNKNLKIIYTVSEDKHDEDQSTVRIGWKEEYGRINKVMILKYLDHTLLNNSIFYNCGPPSMLNAMQSLFQEELKISKEKIKEEEFTGY
jgi:glycine betaine catabolism B